MPLSPLIDDAGAPSAFVNGNSVPASHANGSGSFGLIVSLGGAAYGSGLYGDGVYQGGGVSHVPSPHSNSSGNPSGHGLGSGSPTSITDASATLSPL